MTDGFTHKEQEIVYISSVVPASLSFFCCLLALWTVTRFPIFWRRLAFRVVINLLTADMGANISYFLGNPEHGSGLCTFQGFWQQFCELAALLWTLVIVWTLYRAIVLRVVIQESDYDLSMRWYCACTWGLSFVIALLPLSTSSYGSSGSWCWIKSKEKDDITTTETTVWRFCIYYGPLWAILLLNVFILSKVHGTLSRFRAFMSTASITDDRDKEMFSIVNQLGRFPAIIVLCWSFGTINRIQESVTQKRVLWLTILQVLGSSSAGACNALAFFLCPAVKDHFNALWARLSEERAKGANCGARVKLFFLAEVHIMGPRRSQNQRSTSSADDKDNEHPHTPSHKSRSSEESPRTPIITSVDPPLAELDINLEEGEGAQLGGATALTPGDSRPCRPRTCNRVVHVVNTCR